MADERKAKRRLTNLDFSQKKCHVALVDHGAIEHDETLVLKRKTINKKKEDTMSLDENKAEEILKAKVEAEAKVEALEKAKVEAEAKTVDDGTLSTPSKPTDTMTLPVSAPDRPESSQAEMNFGEAFAINRAAGKGEFTWRGNKYSTEIA